MNLLLSYSSDYDPSPTEDCNKPYLLQLLLKKLDNKTISLDQYFSELQLIKMQIDELDQSFWSNGNTNIEIYYYTEQQIHTIDFSFSYYTGTLTAKQIK